MVTRTRSFGTLERRAGGFRVRNWGPDGRRDDSPHLFSTKPDAEAWRVGNTVGTVMFQAAAWALSEHEAALIEGYRAERRVLAERLGAEYHYLMSDLEQAMDRYLQMLSLAFSPDGQVALEASIELALAAGVASNDVLDSEAKARAFFLD